MINKVIVAGAGVRSESKDSDRVSESEEFNEAPSKIFQV